MATDSAISSSPTSHPHELVRTTVCRKPWDGVCIPTRRLNAALRLTGWGCEALPSPPPTSPPPPWRGERRRCHAPRRSSGPRALSGCSCCCWAVHGKGRPPGPARLWIIRGRCGRVSRRHFSLHVLGVHRVSQTKHTITQSQSPSFHCRFPPSPRGSFRGHDPPPPFGRFRGFSGGVLPPLTTANRASDALTRSETASPRSAQSAGDTGSYQCQNENMEYPHHVMRF